MPQLAYPLERNEIRRASTHNAFGMVRHGGQSPHQGWDLIALPFTPCFAIADGKILYSNPKGKFGNLIVLEFTHRGRTLYAAYAHLHSIYAHQPAQVSCGDMIGLTGTTGNAQDMRGSDQHLHFEIRTTPFPGKGLAGRIDPAQLYGAAPLNGIVFEGRSVKLAGRNLSGPRGLPLPNLGEWGG